MSSINSIIKLRCASGDASKILVSRFWETLLSHVFLLFCWAITSWELERHDRTSLGAQWRHPLLGRWTLCPYPWWSQGSCDPSATGEGPAFCCAHCIGLVKGGMFMSFAPRMLIHVCIMLIYVVSLFLTIWLYIGWYVYIYIIYIYGIQILLYGCSGQFKWHHGMSPH